MLTKEDALYFFWGLSPIILGLTMLTFCGVAETLGIYLPQEFYINVPTHAWRVLWGGLVRHFSSLWCFHIFLKMRIFLLFKKNLKKSKKF